MNLLPISQKKSLRDSLGLHEDATPFPWQEQLLNEFLRGWIPRMLDIPTGLGKTAVMAIWLVALANGAKLPRRLVYVVDRRAVVDQATTEAERLRNWLERETHAKSMLGLTRPLPISTLRGQYVDNREWLEDPASPAIIVGTVDMVGSRVLFEGYGVSRKMRPYHAGLLGTDTLVVLDEAHLVPPFEKLIEAIADGWSEFGPRNEAGPNLIPPFKLMSLSATGRNATNVSHELTAQDFLHPVVRKRLEAKKRLVFKPLDSTSLDLQQAEVGDIPKKQKLDLADKLAREAWRLAEDGAVPSRVIVFCNSREVAADAKRAVENLIKGDKIETELFVGGRRVFEREEASKRLQDLGFIAGSNVARAKPVFLFATSAAEVGVDLDADHMICDLVAWERMVQRLGRVNRRGDGDASVVVIVQPEPKNIHELMNKLPSDRPKKEAAVVERVERSRAVRKAIEKLPAVDGAQDASPGALRRLKQDADKDPELKKCIDDATTPAPFRPALTRALVDAWAMTSLDKHTGRPEIDPWLRGWIENDPPQTAVVWRTHLPVRSAGREPTSKEIESFFEAAPPHSSELLETETYRVIGWLEKRAKSLRSRAAKNAQEKTERPLPGNEDVVAFVLAPDGGLVRPLRLRDLDDTDKRRKEELEKALGHATIIVDEHLAGLKDGLLDENENTSPRTADDGQEWLGERVIRFRARSVSAGAPVVADRDWRERLRFAADVSEEGEAQQWLIIEKWRHDAATEEDRSAARPQLLDEHQSWAEQRARELAKRLGLEWRYEEMLGMSARLHDEGKQAKRWQRAFNAPEDGPYAKTKGPINYSLLDGYRHEFGSLPYAERHDRIKSLPKDLCDLALHLIVAHHGFARPVIGVCGCEDAPPSELEHRAREIALRFARVQRRWGPWGLAWWEALLRAADQQASRDNDAADGTAETEVV